MSDVSRSAHDHLDDVSFLLPFSFDCEQRAENLWAVASWIRRHFRGPILVGGQDLDRVAGHLRDLAVELVPVPAPAEGGWQGAPVRNALAEVATTPVVAVWDVDVWCPPHQVRTAVARIRSGHAAFAYPYDGTFVHVDRAAAYAVSKGIAHPHEAHIVTTHPGESFGGAVLFDADAYATGGRENVRFVGWGPEDRERYDRFTGRGYRCARADGPLYHLDHDRPHERYHGHPSYRANMQLLYGRPSLGHPAEDCPVCRTADVSPR